MISTGLARQLKERGLRWTPALHDKFMIPDRNLDQDVFVIAELTIDVESVAGHATIMFNGAVEWSLDYIFSQDVVWLPEERQLRDRLGEHFVALSRGEEGFKCEIDVDGMVVMFTAPQAEDAYGQALLHLLYAESPDSVSLQTEAAPPVWGAEPA